MQPRPMFQHPAFDPDTIRLMGAAFDDVCRALAADRRDLASRLIARKIIDLTRAGARDRAQLCHETLAYFGLDGDDRRTRGGMTDLSGSGNSSRINARRELDTNVSSLERDLGT